MNKKKILELNYELEGLFFCMNKNHIKIKKNLIRNDEKNKKNC